MKAVVVFSGGMDSATLLYHYKTLGYEVHCVSFDYGQRHGSRELAHARELTSWLGVKHDVVEMGFMRDLLHGSSLTSEDVAVPDGHYAEETMRITVVPNRNAIMLAIATGVAVAEGAEVVATGIHGGDHFIYPDCRPPFFEALRDAFVHGTQGHAVNGFTLEAPFIDRDKAGIAAYGEVLGVPWEKTWSCYKGGDVHCGTCGTCYERQEAFLEAGVDDPTPYLARPADLMARYA